MKEKTPLQQLQKLVLSCKASVLYKPTSQEIDFEKSSFPLKTPSLCICLPKEKESDPFRWAEICSSSLKGKKVCILIPGTRFDAHGTRHGRGFGWYDRFLSKLPLNWLRIGIIQESKFSNSRLKRHPWDQPVDWILTYDGDSWKANKAEVTSIEDTTRHKQIKPSSATLLPV